MSKQNPIKTNLAAFLSTKNGRFNLWWQAAFIMLCLFAITALLWWIDPRQLDGVSVWSKPLKFEISLMIYFITLTLLANLLPAAIRNGKLWTWSTYIAVGAGLFEIFYIIIQAARGRHSHFNHSTPLESAMYGMMGLGAVALVAVSFYLGLLLYRNHYQGEPKIKTAAAWGLMLGSVLTLFTASVMSSLPSHFVGTPGANAWIVPVFGWSLSGGDLRIPHFFATHLMQFLPLYGWWLGWKKTNLAWAQLELWVFTFIYVLVVLALFATSFIAVGT